MQDTWTVADNQRSRRRGPRNANTPEQHGMFLSSAYPHAATPPTSDSNQSQSQPAKLCACLSPTMRDATSSQKSARLICAQTAETRSRRAEFQAKGQPARSSVPPQPHHLPQRMVVLSGLPGAGMATNHCLLSFQIVNQHQQLKWLPCLCCRQNYLSHQITAHGLDMDKPGEHHSPARDLHGQQSMC